jgi:hypothetical protein
LTELEYFEDIEEDEGSYLSYNFGCFSDIWYERESFGKTTEDFAKDLRAASKELTENKISAEIPGVFLKKQESLLMGGLLILECFTGTLSGF